MMKQIMVSILSVVTFSSCYIPAQQAFFFSPHHTTTNFYKTLPMVSDSLVSATYISATGTAGGANHRLRDGVLGFQGNFHQSRQFNHFQAYYGGDLSMGLYKVNDYSFPANHVDAIMINEKAGSKSYGGFGVQAGINYVKPFRNGEWRILGLEANTHREYGSYYKFRQDMPVEAVNLIDKNRMFSTFTVSTDIVGRFSDGSTIGYKLAYIQSFRKLSGVDGDDHPVSGFPRCASHTLHITVNKWTGYGQMNFGSDAFNFQLGFARRIAAKRR